MPSRLVQLFCFFLVTAGIFRLAAAPAVSNVQNATTNIPQGLPNAQIAQGSLFVIKGSGLGPANIVDRYCFPGSQLQPGVTAAVARTWPRSPCAVRPILGTPCSWGTGLGPVINELSGSGLG
jgi:hypothetical protein